MKRYYENIPTFSNDIYKRELRETVLNPLINQHNNMALDLTNHNRRIDDLEGAIVPNQGVQNFKDLKDVPEYEEGKFLKVSEAGTLMWDVSGGNEVDLTPITERLDVVEPKVTTLETSSADYKTRIEALELGGGSGGDVNLKPILDRLDAAEPKIETLETSVADHETRVDAMEPKVDTLVTDNAVNTGKIASIEEDIKGHSDKITANEATLASHYQQIIKNKDDITEIKMSGGGGVGPGVDLGPIIERVSAVETKADSLDVSTKANKSLIDDIQIDVTSLETSTLALESRVGVLEETPVTPITKWYVLPLAGQSNMWGCGEQPWTVLDNPDPRLMQLTMLDSNPEGTSADKHNVDANCTPYGDKWDIYRPTVDTNLTMIPAVPCLDSNHNGWHAAYYTPVAGGTPAQTHKHGNVGMGYYVAQEILKYLPKEYGICIINCSRGGGGICANASGTYDETAMRPSADANGHQWGSPYNRMMQDRLKFVLDQNQDNKLLPLIWMQGESDPDGGVDHYTRFKEFTTSFKTYLTDNNLAKHLPGGSVENMKIICLGTTKVQFGEDCGFDYVNISNYASGDYKKRARFDNYAYLADDEVLRNAQTGEGYITYLRTDVDETGMFVETALEENRTNGTSKIFSSNLDTHYSTKALQTTIPRLVVNAIAGSKTGYLEGVPHRMWTRPIAGGLGSVTTDNCTYHYNMNPDMSFDPNANSLVKMLFPLGVSEVSELVASATSTIVTETMDGMTVAKFDGNHAHYWYGAIDTVGATNTVSVMFKMDVGNRAVTQYVLGSDSGHDGLALFAVSGQLYIEPDGNIASKMFGLNKSVDGAWKGNYDSWQHLTISSSGTLGLVNFYLNGCFIGTIKGTNSNLGFLQLGRFSTNSNPLYGRVKTFRVYDKCLTSEEAAALYIIDSNITGVVG